MTIESTRLLNVREAAEVLSICERTLHSITAPRGPLQCVRIQRAVRYSPESLERFIEQQQTCAAT